MTPARIRIVAAVPTLPVAANGTNAGRGSKGVTAVFPVGHAGPVVVLVPRQIRMVGMTGDVPYYGGRFTPAQAYAASHPMPQPASSPAAPAPVVSREDQVEALQRLLDTSVITQEEFDELQARVDQ